MKTLVLDGFNESGPVQSRVIEAAASELKARGWEWTVLAPREIGRASPRNLSRNGIIFGSPEVLEVGEEIEIRLLDSADSDEGSLRLRGTVVRLEQIPEQDQIAGTAVRGGGDRYEIGMAFDLDSGDADRDLLEFLERARGAGRGPRP